MNNLLQGFADELTKVGFKLKANKSTGPAGNAGAPSPMGYGRVAAPKPLGSGGGPTSAGLTGIGRQQMNFSAKQKKPKYVSAGTQKFAPAKPPEVQKNKKGGGRRKRGAKKDLGPAWETGAQRLNRRVGEQRSATKAKGRTDSEWFQKQTPKAGGKPTVKSTSDQARYSKLKAKGNTGRWAAAHGKPIRSTGTTLSPSAKARQARLSQSANKARAIVTKPNLKGLMRQ